MKVLFRNWFYTIKRFIIWCAGLAASGWYWFYTNFRHHLTQQRFKFRHFPSQRTRRTMRLVTHSAIFILLFTGCSDLEARDEAYAGKHDLENCSFQSALDHFERAYELKPENIDIILGLAISKTLALADSDDINQRLHQLGFTQSIGEYCQTLKESEQTVTESVDNQGCITQKRDSWHFPHPCAENDQCQYADVIDPEMTWSMIFDVVKSHHKEISDLSDLYLTASRSVDIYTIDSIAGIHDLKIHRADLLLFSALLSAVLWLDELSGYYDLKFSVSDSLKQADWDCQRRSAWINQNFGIYSPDHQMNAKQAVQRFVSMMYKLRIMAELAYKIRTDFDDKSQHDPCTSKESIFQFQKIPYGVINNIRDIASTFDIPPYISQEYLQPPTWFDIDTLMSGPPARSRDVQITTCQRDKLICDWSELIQTINRSTFPPVLDNSNQTRLKLKPEMEYRLSSGWLKWSPVDIL